ncbi:hypothetical protein DICPUDRAFT_154219, partial [Dictyostelium purpureum]
PKLIIDGTSEYSFSCTDAKLQICILQHNNNNYTEVGTIAKKLTMDSALTMEDRMRIKLNSTEAEKLRKERKTVFLDNNNSSSNSINSGSIMVINVIYLFLCTGNTGSINSNTNNCTVKRKPNFVSLPKPLPTSSYSSSTQVIPPPPTIPSSVANISTTSKDKEQTVKEPTTPNPIPAILHTTPTSNKDSILKDINISGGSSNSSSSGGGSNNGTPFSPQLNYSSSTPSPVTSLSPEYHTPNRSPNSSKSTSSPRPQLNSIKEQQDHNNSNINSHGHNSNNNSSSSNNASFLSLEKDNKPKKKSVTPTVPLGLKGDALDKYLLHYLPFGITNQVLKSRYDLEQPNNYPYLNKVGIFKSPGVWWLKDEFFINVSVDFEDYKPEERNQVKTRRKEALLRCKVTVPEQLTQVEKENNSHSNNNNNNNNHNNSHYNEFSNGQHSNKLNLNNLNGHLDRVNDSISPRNKNYQQVNKKQRIIPPPASVKNTNINNNNNWLSVNSNNSVNENDSNSSRSNSPILSPSGSPNKSNELLPWSTKSVSSTSSTSSTSSISSTSSTSSTPTSNKNSHPRSKSSNVQDREHKEREREHKEREHKEREHKEKEHKEKEHKEREHKEREHREREHKEREHKEREHKEREHIEREHRENKEKEPKEKEHKEKENNREHNKERDNYKEKEHNRETKERGSNNSELNEVLPSHKIPLSSNSSVSSSSTITNNSISAPMISKPHTTIIPKVSTGFLSKLDDRISSLNSQPNQESSSSTPSSNSRPNSARGSDNSLKRKMDSIRQDQNDISSNTTTPPTSTPVKSTSTSTTSTPTPSSAKLTTTTITTPITTIHGPIECVKEKVFIINSEDDFKLMLELSKSKYQRYTQIHKFITMNIQDFQKLQREMETCDNNQQKKVYTEKIYGLYVERKEASYNR